MSGGAAVFEFVRRSRTKRWISRTCSPAGPASRRISTIFAASRKQIAEENWPYAHRRGNNVRVALEGFSEILVWRVLPSVVVGLVEGWIFQGISSALRTSPVEPLNIVYRGANFDHQTPGCPSYNVLSSQLKPVDDATIRRLRFEILKPASQPSRVCSYSLSDSRTHRIKRTCVSLPREARKHP